MTPNRITEDLNTTRILPNSQTKLTANLLTPILKLNLSPINLNLRLLDNRILDHNVMQPDNTPLSIPLSRAR